ncbi:MAG: sugar transferase [Planctomycetes bacterium]|nr:sugar transferase [Planctomycetota bacterium]
MSPSVFGNAGIPGAETTQLSDSGTIHDSETKFNGSYRDRPARETAPSGRRTIAVKHRWYLPIKRVVDFIGAVTLLILLSPCLLVGAILVKLTSRGPAFYRQVRVGKDNREFTLYKLRSMRADAEAKTGPVWSTQADPRVTPIGKLLRTSHIDEFPQLWNVICGDMSLIGPRPERPEFVAKLDWEVPYYRERLRVRPGISGLAQLKLPPDTDLESVCRKVEHDIFYVQNCHPWLDAKLMIGTAWRLVHELVSFFWKALTLPSTDDITRGFERAVDSAAPEHGIARLTIQKTAASQDDTCDVKTELSAGLSS